MEGISEASVRARVAFGFVQDRSVNQYEITFEPNMMSATVHHVNSRAQTSSLE